MTEQEKLTFLRITKMLLNLYNQGILLKSVNIDTQDLTIFLNKIFIRLKYSQDNADKAAKNVLQEIKDCGSAIIRNPELNTRIEIIGD